MDEMTVKRGEMFFDLQPCTYHGEDWYAAKLGFVFAEDKFAIIAYGRTPGRALGIAMLDMAKCLMQGAVRLSPWRSAVRAEICDVSFNGVVDGKEA